MKHPVLISRVRLVVWWLVWLFLGLGQALLYFYAYGSFINISIIDSLLSLLLYSGIALSLWYPFSIFMKDKDKPLMMIVNIVTIGAITVTLWVLITKLIMTSVLPDQEVYLNFWEATFPYRVGTGVFSYGLVILTYFLFVSLSHLS